MTVTEWHFADVWDEISRHQPNEVALVQGDRRRTWSEFRAHAHSLALQFSNFGVTAGETIAQYMTNSIEYLETVYACFAGSFAPVNTNYRYIADELCYLWQDSGVAAVVFHGKFTETIEALRAEVANVRLWVWVNDNTSPCPNWAVAYDTLIHNELSDDHDSWLPSEIVNRRRGDDLYLLYTGGTTGKPKGVMWRQDDLFCVLNRGGALKYDESAGVAGVRPALEEFDRNETDKGRPCTLPAAPLMHGTAAFASFGALNSGGSVVMTEDPKFAADRLLDAIEKNRVTDIAIVGDAFARPILTALDAEPQRWDISSLRIVLSSGVMWSLPIKEGLLRHNQNILCVDTLGSSEAVGLARSITSTKRKAQTADFALGPHSAVIRDDGTPVEPGEIGLVAIAGRGPIGYYNDPEKSARTFRVIDGVRWTTPGDFAQVRSDGSVQLLGRGSSCINTGGEKVFPEEVEEALKECEGVVDAVVVGAPHERFGQQIVAFVVADPAFELSATEVQNACRTKLADYKVPRHLSLVPSLDRAVNGKIDQARWKNEAERLAERNDQ